MRAVVGVAWLAACAFAPHETPRDAMLSSDSSDSRTGDPCSVDNGGCPAACMVVAGSATCYAPATCSQIPDLVDDTSVTLYLDGSAGQPWTAYCHDDLEYLTVTPATNFGEYAMGGKSPGSNVITAYARLRLDPSTLKVDICDQTFGSSMGTLSHDPANHDPPIIVTSMPLGVAMDCVGDASKTGSAELDLTGTPFMVSSMSTWSTGGNGAGSALTVTGRAIALSGGGNCGWFAPTGAPGNPFNTFGTASLIELTYAP